MIRKLRNFSSLKTEIKELAIQKWFIINFIYDHRAESRQYAAWYWNEIRLRSEKVRKWSNLSTRGYLAFFKVLLLRTLPG